MKDAKDAAGDVNKQHSGVDAEAIVCGDGIVAR
jgi:hypothetical protein